MDNSETQLPYLIALSSIPGVGSILAKQLISYCGSAQEVFTSSHAQLLKIPSIGRQLAKAIRERPLLEEAQAQLSAARQQEVAVLSYLSPHYPARLKHTPDSPLVLFSKGQADLNAGKVLAVVGTRKATAYGKSATISLIDGLKDFKDLLIVSGLAYGIDITAHRECLRVGIPTVGVQANGLGMVYPPLHHDTAQQMLWQQGGLLSEYPLDARPDAHRFPSRNRIIAGLADVVVVAEARSKGGALITASLANSYNREVCAIPGDIRRDTYAGCHRLIRKNQAHLITNAADLAELMGWEKSQSNQNGFQLFLTLEKPEERKVCEILRQGDLQLDLLSIQSGIPLNKLAGLLLNLEFRGLVRSAPGKIFGLAKKV